MAGNPTQPKPKLRFSTLTSSVDPDVKKMMHDIVREENRQPRTLHRMKIGNMVYHAKYGKAIQRLAKKGGKAAGVLGLYFSVKEKINKN